jgi:hypothetical protein
MGKRKTASKATAVAIKVEPEIKAEDAGDEPPLTEYELQRLAMWVSYPRKCR